MYGEIEATLRVGQCFKLEFNPLLTISGNQGVYLGIISDMVEAGVWRLPYERIWVEAPGLLLGADGEVSDETCNMGIMCHEEAPGSIRVFGFQNIPAARGKTWWATPLQLLAVEDKTLSETDKEVLVDHGWDAKAKAGVRYSSYAIEASSLAAKFSDEDGHEQCGTYLSVLNVLLVALCTKGVAVEKRHQRVVLTKRDKPVLTHHFLRVDPVCSKAAGGGEIGERKRVRLHLRRGHIRKQPHGPNNTLVKIIFINPMLVGYEEEGTVTHEYEIEDPP